jgi:DNA-directed RNA polymerase subunit omega
MLDELKIDELLDKKIDSRYGLVTAAARRARQINEYTATLGIGESLGIPGPQVHPNSQHPLTIAIEELREGKLKVIFSDEEPAETSTRQEEAPESDAGAEAASDEPEEESHGAA